MDFAKRKYKREEVQKIIDAVVGEYESKLTSQKNRISQLLSENKRLTYELGVYEDKESLVVTTLKSAEEKAEELKENERLRYSLSVESLKNFASRWQKYFEYLLEKYPYYPEIEEASKTVKELKTLFTKRSSAEILDFADSFIDKRSVKGKRQVFDPKEKIDAYIAASGSNGFNLDEVLNPGELKLEDLCKELGLTEDE